MIGDWRLLDSSVDPARTFADAISGMLLVLSLIVSLLILEGCASSGLFAAPTLTPTLTPAPTPTLVPIPYPTLSAFEDHNIPPCDGFTVLPEAFPFTWPGIEEALDISDWGYFRCTTSVSEAAAFYRAKMTQPPYNWQEFNWVELPEGTLGVYFHTVYQRWFYLWILPTPASRVANLVLAQRDLDTPLVLPCCQ